MLAVCSVVSGNVVMGGPGSVPGRIVQGLLHAFAWIYPVFMLVGCELVADASGEPTTWEVYLWVFAFFLTAALPYTVVRCYSNDALCVLTGLRGELEAQNELLARAIVGQGMTMVPNEDRERNTTSHLLGRVLGTLLVFAPQVVFLIYLYTFFLMPALRAVAGEETLRRDTFLNSDFLLRGEGLHGDVIGTMKGPAVLCIWGSIHVLRIMLVWFTLMETIFLGATWVNACCGSVAVFARSVQHEAGLNEIVGISGMERVRAIAGLSDEDLPIGRLLRDSHVQKDSPTNDVWGRLPHGDTKALPLHPSFEGNYPLHPMRRSLHAFSSLRLGVNTLNTLLTAPMTLTLATFVSYFLIAASISYDGRAGEAQWIVVVLALVILAATLTLLAFMGRVGDGWSRTVNEVGGIDTTFALTAILGESNAARLQESVIRTKVGFQILNVVISTQSIIWLFIYLTILVVSSGILLDGALEDL